MTKDVKGYEGLYTVDEYGNVTNLKTGKLMKQQKNKFGYMNVSLRKDGVQKQHKVHRVVAEAFIPNPTNKLTVNHKDGNKANNRIDNLEWATYKENSIHARDMGLNHSLKSVRIVETGEVFPSLVACAKSINGDIGDIARCLKGITKTHKKYHFEEV